MSTVMKNGKEGHRPAWNYADSRNQPQLQMLEMLESCRNVMEQIRGELQKLNALFGCSNFLAIPQRLAKIEENTRTGAAPGAYRAQKRVRKSKVVNV